MFTIKSQIIEEGDRNTYQEINVVESISHHGRLILGKVQRVEPTGYRIGFTCNATYAVTLFQGPLSCYNAIFKQGERMSRYLRRVYHIKARHSREMCHAHRLGIVSC